jgi:hypothetical protein
VVFWNPGVSESERVGDAGKQGSDRGKKCATASPIDSFGVKRIRDTVAREWMIDGIPLSEYDVNRTLSCSDDWVVDCTHHFSGNDKTYQFPLSRLAPEKYATRATEWKERVRNSKKCFSCGDGRKRRERQSVCHTCRGRIFERASRRDVALQTPMTW